MNLLHVQIDRIGDVFIVASSEVDIVPYLQPDINVSLSDHNQRKITRNTNNLRAQTTCRPDIKFILDLATPPELKKQRDLKKMPYRDGKLDC